MRVTVMDRELHEPLTIVDVPISLIPQRIEGFGESVPRRIYFDVPVREVFYETKIRDAPTGPTRMMSRHTYIELEEVRRTTGRNPNGGWHSELLFWYAYAGDPELALLLRAAFLPGQVGELQMRETEARVTGIFEGIGIGLSMGRRY